MSLNNLVAAFLNIPEDSIESITSIPQSDGTVIVKIRLQSQPVLCPYCGSVPKIHGYYLRKLTHSTFANRKCFIYYNQRRYKCSSCESTFHELNPFSKPNENITYETKINILQELKYVESTYTSVARRFNVSITKVQQIFDKHVNIPRKPLPAVLSMDEHYFPESDYASLYCCLLMDFSTGVLIDVLPDRKQNYLLNYFSKIKASTKNWETNTTELDNVKYISIDMSDLFRNVAKTHFPKAVICADSFHVLQHLTDCFHKVRLRCKRSTENEDLKYLLTKFKFIFRHKQMLDNEPKYNKRFGRYMNYRDIRTLLFESFRDLSAAYELKELYIRFNETTLLIHAKDELEKVMEIFANSGIAEYDEFYTLLTNWKEEIIASFTTVGGKRINNSYIESKNRLLEKLINNANGFTNFQRTRNRILYCLNKNDTYFI